MLVNVGKLMSHTSTKGGGGVKHPFNPSLVDAWFMSGLSNSDKPTQIVGVKKNKLQLKNFTYALNSGFGEYATDFNSWSEASGGAEFTRTSESVHITNVISQARFLYKSSNITLKIKVSGTTDNLYPSIKYGDIWLDCKTDGIYSIENTDNKEINFVVRSGIGSCNITITQLPTAYEGALVFDGVDDYGICNNLPILTDYTVICKREIINKETGSVASKRTSSSQWDGAFIFERNNQLTSFGQNNYRTIQQDSVSYMTATSYNGDIISRGSLQDTEYLILGADGFNIDLNRAQGFSNCAIYYFALYDKSLTPEEIETEKERLNEEWKRRLNKEEPAWYTEALICEYNPIRQGCTNQNMNADHVLRDLSGNGYHMDCYNFAWNTQSGIYDDGSLILDGVDDYLKVTGLPIMDDFTVMVQNYRYNFKPSILASKSYPTANDGAFMLENVDGGDRGSLRSFGNPGWVTYVQETVNVMAMTKTECYKDFDNNVNFYITPGTGVDSDTLWIGKIRDNNSVFGKTRLYSFLMFNRSLTKKEMDWVRNNKMN